MSLACSNCSANRCLAWPYCQQSDSLIEDDKMQILIIGLCASVTCVGLWLSILVSQAVYRLGWKKVEYIYTEREKAFVGVTIVRTENILNLEEAEWSFAASPFRCSSSSHSADICTVQYTAGEDRGCSCSSRFSH